MTHVSRHDLLPASGSLPTAATPEIGWIASSDQRMPPAVADLTFVSISIDESPANLPDLNLVALDRDSADSTLQKVRVTIGEMAGLIAIVGAGFAPHAWLFELGADDVIRDPTPQEVTRSLRRLRRVVDRRKRDHAALLAVGEERDYLQASIDSLPSPIYFKNRDGLYVGFNKAFQRYLGLPPDPHGYDAGKKIKGKKRHILVDTQGLLIHAIVHAADIQDRDGGMLVMATMFGMYPFLLKLYADGGYQGPVFRRAVTKIMAQVNVEIVKRSDHAKGFVVLPRRWVVTVRTMLPGRASSGHRSSKSGSLADECSRQILSNTRVNLSQAI